MVSHRTTESTSAKCTDAAAELQLPMFNFNGDVLQWVSFFRFFRFSRRQRSQPEQHTKVSILEGSTHGRSHMDGLPLTNQNYGQALDLLKKRYGQTHKIVTAHMKSLWDLPRPTCERDSLHTFCDTLESSIRRLEALGKGEDSYGYLLVPLILEKLCKHFMDLGLHVYQF
ncbi:uncharacterized protein LOC144440722 [Glandiceps talaboti]